MGRGIRNNRGWMITPYVSGSSRRKGARIDGLLVGNSTVQFDKVDQHQPVRRLTIFFGFGKQGALVVQRIRARSLAFLSHNGTPSDLASARSSFSHCSWYSSCASPSFWTSNVSVGVLPISIVKILGRTFGSFPLRRYPRSPGNKTCSIFWISRV